MKDYTNKGYASKLSLEKLKQILSQTNGIAYPAVKGIYKPGKMRVVSDAGAKFQSTFLNKNFCKGPDLLNSSIGGLIKF